MSLEANHGTVHRQTEEIWNEGRLDLISTLFSPDFSNFDSPCPLDLFRQIVQAWRTAFPDLQFTTDTQVAQGDQVASLQTLSGTQRGPFVIPGLWNRPPTGKPFTVKQMHLFRLRDGMIIEHWGVRDDLHMLQQLGHLPGLEE
jgi:predicted ester cyclase